MGSSTHSVPSQSVGDQTAVDKCFDAVVSSRLALKNGDEGARERAIQEARKLVSALETPLETILWMIWAEPTNVLAVRLALDLQLFHTLTAENGRPKTAEELAAPVNASPVLVNRIARKLSGMNMIVETGPQQYAPNQLTQVLTIPKYSEGVRFCYDTAGLSFVQMSEFFEKRGFIDPEDPSDGPWQFAYKHPTVWPWLSEHPKIFNAFHTYVHGQREDRPSWTDFYPVEERLVRGLQLSGDASALVDVGGGAGHVLEEFRTRVPEYTGRLVLQEQEAVIELARASALDPRIELTAHDFFTAQPVHGARAYHMRYILHDWSDDLCRKILKHLKAVMTPGYSKILINECVLADQDAAWQHTSLDLFMMALASSRERTEKDWYELIESVGLKVTGIWSQGAGNESLIEVVLA